MRADRRGVAVIASLLAAAAQAQLQSARDGAPGEGASAGFVIAGHALLGAGADAIRAGRYDDGIRLTQMGLERDALSVRDRAAGLGNLCSAYVAKGEADTAIPYCDESLRLHRGNWRVYSARSQAYLLKGMLPEALRDNAAAAAISPNAEHVVMIRGMLNEATLAPQVTSEDHQ